MALFFTELGAEDKDGEKLVYRTLRNVLSDEYAVWHNKRIPPGMWEADVIILHPTDGIWVIEIKDWRREQIVDASERHFRVRKLSVSNEPNPYYQATQNSFRVKELLEKQAHLRQRGGPNDGKLVVPVNSAVAFPNIRSDELAGLEAFLPGKFVLGSDFLRSDLYEAADWEQRLRDCRKVAFRSNLTQEQVEEIKVALGTSRVPGPVAVASAFDDHQEKLAAADLRRQLVIEGPAGSGKSIVLLRRAQLLLEAEPLARILVVCYNALMANYLRQLVETAELEPGVRARLHVYDVHGWVQQYAPHARADVSKDVDAYDRRIEAAALFVSQHPELQYEAVLVDEGQDANDSHLRLYRALLKAPDGPFTFCADARQLLYCDAGLSERLESFGFSIHKERRLVRQQRSALFALALAYYDLTKGIAPTPDQAWQRVSAAVEKFFVSLRELPRALMAGVTRLFHRGRDDGPPDIAAEIAAAVSTAQHASLGDLAADVVGELRRRHQEGLRWGDMMVLYPRLFQAQGAAGRRIQLPALLAERLQQAEIPYSLIGRKGAREYDGRVVTPLEDNRRTVKLENDAVRILTIHQAKGLDAAHVVVAGFDGIDQLDDGNRAAELGYVAITRAKRSARFLYCDETSCVKNLLRTIEVIRVGKAAAPPEGKTGTQSASTLAGGR